MVALLILAGLTYPPGAMLAEVMGGLALAEYVFKTKGQSMSRNMQGF